MRPPLSIGDRAQPVARCAYYELVNVKKVTEFDRPLTAQLEQMLTEKGLADEGQADLHFALAGL